MTSTALTLDALPARRPAFGRLYRAALILCAVSFGASFAAQRAYAMDDGADTPRIFSFGGMCVNCELSGRKLPEARFMGADFAGTSLVGSDLKGASFFGSNFGGADLTRADLTGASLFGSNFNGANFTDANLTSVRGQGVDLMNANLTHAVIVGAMLPGAQLLRVNAPDAQFTASQLFGANMSEGHFERNSFRDTNLAGASLAGANFAGADFHGATLTETSLAGADLSAAKGLTQDQIDQACSGPTTRLPAGLVGRACKSSSHVIILRSPVNVHPGATTGSPKYVVEFRGSPLASSSIKVVVIPAAGPRERTGEPGSQRRCQLRDPGHPLRGFRDDNTF